MQAVPLITITHEPQNPCGSGFDFEYSDTGMALRQFFRPCVLAFLALAVAVGGWGYGYKLSQYLVHPGVTKASSTRLWIEHRNETFVSPQHHKAFPQKLFSPPALTATPVPLTRFSHDLALSAPVPAPAEASLSTLNPLRAPPISGSSLA